MERIKKTDHAFHSFCLRPKIKFEGQNNQEEIILVLRSHPVTQIYWLINGTILLIILLLLNFIFPSFLNISQILFLNLFGLGVIFSYLWFNFLSWYFNVGIVTSERVIDIDFHSVLYKEVTITLINKVEDVTSKTGGFLSAVFDYGNIFVQTAGTEVNIEFLNIPKPALVAKIINQLVRR